MPDPGDKEDHLVFRYSRERRLSQASQAVRDLNASGPRRRPNLFKTLTATRGSSFLLLAILILSATALVTHYLLPADNTAVLEGNRLSMQAFLFENTAYIKVKKTRSSDTAFAGPVSAAVRIGKNGSIRNQELRFSLSETEEFRFSILPEPGQKDVILVLKAGDHAVSMKALME